MTTDRTPTVDLTYIQAATGLKLQIAWSEGDGHHSFATRDHAHGWYNGKIWGWSVEPNPCKPECAHVFDGPPIDGMNVPSLQVKTGSEFPEGLNVVSSGDTGQVDDKPIVHRAWTPAWTDTPARFPCCGQVAEPMDHQSHDAQDVTCPGRPDRTRVTVAAPQVPELSAAMAEVIKSRQARQIAQAFDVGAATHIAGPRVEIAGRVRQRCAWCGESLIDVARERGFFRLGSGEVTEVKTWADGEMVRLAPDGTTTLVAGWLLPDDSCAGS